jgi:hypothetical protein
MRKDEMEGTYSTYGGDWRSIKGFVGETWGKETTWKVEA